MVAAVIGWMLGIGVVCLIEVLDDTLRTPEDATRELSLPVLGLIAHYTGAGVEPITASHPRSPVSEAFRALRTNLQFASGSEPLHTLIVTSPSPKDGKTTVAANLGVIIAQNGCSVALIDADLRRPSVHKFFDLPNNKGISSIFMMPQIALNGNLQETGVAQLWVLPSGPLPQNPSELLGSAKMDEILNSLNGGKDFILIDTPPVLAVTDAIVLAPRVDGVLLVVRPGVTRLAACKHAVEQLRRVGAKLVGVVFDDVDIHRPCYRYVHYRGYYNDTYGEYYRSAKKTGDSVKTAVR
jgi:non-specific protein-tyrosine kinase